MKNVYVIELENGNFADLDHEVGTHVIIEEKDNALDVYHFEKEEDAKHYLDDFKRYKKYGFGYEHSNNSLYQFHGEFSDLVKVREIEITYKIIDEKVQEDRKDQRNVIHDSYYDVTGKVPTDEQIKSIVEQIPKNIYLLAAQWGWSDTEVREFVFRFIRDVICND